MIPTSREDQVALPQMNLSISGYGPNSLRDSQLGSSDVRAQEISILLYNILLINQYTGNITTKHHSGSMGDNTYSCLVLHQKIYSLPVSMASDTRCF